MNGFERRKEFIKEKIKKTVLDMLGTCEPQKIRVVDIAARADVSQVTIYNYFGGKEKLLQEVFKDYIDKSITDFEDFIRGGPSLKEIIQYVVFVDKEAYRSFTPQFFKLLLNPDREMGQYIDELYRVKAMPLLVRFIEEGRKKGEISTKVSTPTILAYFNLFKAQTQALVDMAEQSGKIDDFLEEIIHLFFYGISSGTASE